MKKFLLLALLLCAVFSSHAQINYCMGNNGGSYGNGDICQNFKNNDGATSMQYLYCCQCSYTNHSGCPVAQITTPINSGLIFLILAGGSLGAYMLKKNMASGQAIA